MQIGERYFDDGGKLVRQVTYDPNPGLLAASKLREMHAGNRGDWQAVGTYPAWLVTLWLKRAGVKWNDPAANDVIRREIASGNWARFAVEPGRKYWK